jgi:hypothetical protein
MLWVAHGGDGRDTRLLDVAFIDHRFENITKITITSGQSRSRSDIGHLMRAVHITCSMHVTAVRPVRAIDHNM